MENKLKICKGMTTMTGQGIIQTIDRANQLGLADFKISYMILKPNAAKHYDLILKEIEKSNFIILDQYAIFDYELVNMTLHLDQPSAMKYLIPISKMYHNFYGNYGILLLIGKYNISYEYLCLQVAILKKRLRAQFDVDYVGFAFDTSNLGEENKHERLIILSNDGKEIKKGRFNEEGTYMVFMVNEIHSPDEKLSSLQNEMHILDALEIFDVHNVLQKNIIDNIRRYHSFEFLIDLQ